MGVLNSLFSALLMYSRIPAPQVEWKEENRRYALCFFPVIGAVIGALLIGWHQLCLWFGIGSGLFAAAAVGIPFAVTGGIHMDGYCDAADAQASCAPKEKKLEIMSDPHIGSFALIRAALYLFLQFGLFSECGGSDRTHTIWIIALGYPVSRALSGLAAVLFRSAKRQGALQAFVLPAHRNVTIAVLTGIVIVCGGLMIWLEPFAGTAELIAALLVFGWYRRFAYQKFGGVTGDLAGYFLQVCELAELAAAVFAGMSAAL